MGAVFGICYCPTYIVLVSKYQWCTDNRIGNDHYQPILPYQLVFSEINDYYNKSINIIYHIHMIIISIKALTVSIQLIFIEIRSNTRLVSILALNSTYKLQNLSTLNNIRALLYSIIHIHWIRRSNS